MPFAVENGLRQGVRLLPRAGSTCWGSPLPAESVQCTALLKAGQSLRRTEVPPKCQQQEERNFSNPFSLKEDIITTQESKDRHERWGQRGRLYLGVLFLVFLKKGRLTQQSLAKCHTAAARAKIAAWLLTLVDQENNYLSLSYISWAAKQETESSEHFSPREYMNKNATAVGSASFCILFQTPCCTSKCHYGPCYTAAGMRMWVLEQER